MSFRSWVTIITLILLALVVFFGWGEIMQAWGLLGQVSVGILLLLIPVQIFSYYATGGTIFSYLRSKGNLKTTNHWQMARMSLELNFVNHILPSGGAAGFSYLGWVLHRFGVSPGRATMAQIVRFALTFVSFIVMLVVTVIALTLDHKIDRVIIMICTALAFATIGATILAVYIISNKARMLRFAGWLTRTINKFLLKVSRKKERKPVKLKVIEDFFSELHQDYLEIRREKKILAKPFVWALLGNISDVALLFIAFWALGFIINPAMLFVAYGISSIASVFTATPGGAGVYEAVMIAFLASAGVSADVAIAGTLLARVTLLLGTILFGYAFYQLTVSKYGKSPSANL